MIRAIHRAVLLLAGLIAWSALPVCRAQSERPNIVLIMTDDQGYGPVGRHGHPWLQTPALDRLYDSSTRFTRFLVSPTCSPTRSALMTGRHPMRNGVTHTIRERERMTLDAVTLPEVLGEAGYTSAIFGKWHLGDEDAYQPHNRGFDHAFIHGAGGIGQAYDCSCADAPDNSYFDPIVRVNGTFMKTEGFCTDVFFRGALDWIGEVRDESRPFFAYIATNAPHGPFLAPDEYRQRFLDMGFSDRQAGFYGMIENIDTNVGQLMQRLDDWNLLDNTVVIFMSDNGTTGAGAGRPGMQLGEDADGNALKSWNAGMKGLKGSPDEGGVRVPFFVRWDGHFAAGRDIDRIAAHIDVFPTIADLAGAELPEDQVEGRSLVPLLQDASADWADRLLFTHCGRWPTGADPDEFQWKRFAVRNQRFRLVAGNDDAELFDMQEDPGQTTDVADQHPQVVADMRAAYDRWWQDTRPLMVNEGVPMSPTRPFHVHYRRQQEESGIPRWEPQQ